ncbi:MAG: DNA-binding response regulator [Gammaproteobacteria bacterium]|nr:DNA-binding response regulator [Gammaproteobacteria bacterium]
MIQQFKGKFVVLVVDDDPGSLSMINMALDDVGIAVLVALNGQQALNVLDQVTPDVILLDALMPVMDGYETARNIRRILPLVPVIFMTGLSEEEDIVKAFESGGSDYIVKPIKPQELLARIRQHSNAAKMLIEARQALDTASQHVFCIDGSGHVLWATPEAQQLLDEFCTEQNGDTLSTKFRSWLPNGMSGHDLALPYKQELLTVRYFKQGREDEFLLKVQLPTAEVKPAVLESALRITHREAEVLLWVAHGKTNREIAEILDMSPRTVNKHLEQMYPKIGADNRTSAASIAIQSLLGGRIGRPV